MNRRELLLCGLAIPAASVADCRDDNGMIMPDPGSSCYRINIRRNIAGTRTVARAWFGFGAYETLRERQGVWYQFEYKGKAYKIRVTSVSVDVDQEFGCVLATVDGRLLEFGDV